MTARFVAATFASLALAACAATPSERNTTTSEYATSSRRAAVDGDASVVHLRHEPWGEFTIGGMPDGGATTNANGPTELVAVNVRDAGTSASSGDAGPVSAELSWLVAHIAEGPDRLRSDDSNNARQLAARGADGVRAVVSIFARGDALRLPFARRVVERNVVRVCGSRDPEAAQELVTWIELGGVPQNATTGAIRWSRTGDTPWSASALARLEEWVAHGMPCTPPELPSSSSAPPAGSSPRPPANGREPAASRRP